MTRPIRLDNGPTDTYHDPRLLTRAELELVLTMANHRYAWHLPVGVPEPQTHLPVARVWTNYLLGDYRPDNEAQPTPVRGHITPHNHRVRDPLTLDHVDLSRAVQRMADELTEGHWERMVTTTGRETADAMVQLAGYGQVLYGPWGTPDTQAVAQ